jgi:hypothetical protein
MIVKTVQYKQTLNCCQLLEKFSSIKFYENPSNCSRSVARSPTETKGQINGTDLVGPPERSGSAVHEDGKLKSLKLPANLFLFTNLMHNFFIL